MGANISGFKLPIIYWVEAGYPWLACRYLKNSLASPVKEFSVVGETKLNTLILPFMPTQRSQVLPTMATVAMHWPMGQTLFSRASLEDA